MSYVPYRAPVAGPGGRSPTPPHAEVFLQASLQTRDLQFPAGSQQRPGARGSDSLPALSPGSSAQGQGLLQENSYHPYYTDEKLEVKEPQGHLLVTPWEIVMFTGFVLRRSFSDGGDLLFALELLVHLACVDFRKTVQMTSVKKKGQFSF